MTKEIDPVLATVRPSSGRRVLGVGCFGILGVLMFWIALTQNPDLMWRAFLIIVGLVALVMTAKILNATAGCVELTETQLRDSDGTVIALTQDILSIDRGVFAFKPSNGFLLKTSNAKGRFWRPGLWWRAGNRVGVGGMTQANQTKMMAEIISAIIVKRDLNI